VVGLQAPAIMLLGVPADPGHRHAPTPASTGRAELRQRLCVGRQVHSDPWLGFLVGWVTIVGDDRFLAYTSAVTGSVMIQLAGRGLDSTRRAASPSTRRRPP
jgi:hypothetical protein